MMKGRCSQYPGVVHQYIDRNRPYMATAPGLPVGDAKPKMAGDACSGTQYPSTDLLGYPVASFPSTSAGACCITIGDKAGPGTYWSYDGTNCTAYSSVYKSNQRAGYTSGVTDGPFDPSNVQDLYDYSCLNGYTMGNIATTPTDVVKFYAALTTGRIVSKKSLAEMQTYEKLTAGYQPPPGTPYGLGLMTYPLSFWLKNTSSLSKNCKKYPEFCKCESAKSKSCKGHFQMWGHPGLDWASGMPFLGAISGLNMSFAMAFDSYHGFNSSMTFLENKNTYQYANTQCMGFDAAVHHVWPDFPEFNCDKGRYRRH